MVIAVIVLALAGLALLKTRIGKATRAVADNPALAALRNQRGRVIMVVWILGAALAGLGGCLPRHHPDRSGTDGPQFLLLIFAAVTWAASARFGALVGSLVVGIFVQLSTLWINPELKNVGGPVLVMIIVLLIRPQGLLGRRSRVG